MDSLRNLGPVPTNCNGALAMSDENWSRQDLPPEPPSFETLRNHAGYVDWELEATNRRFTISLSHAPRKLNMKYAPVRRAILDPYEQKYGKEMYMSDISDSDSESRSILISRGRKSRRGRRIIFDDIV